MDLASELAAISSAALARFSMFEPAVYPSVARPGLIAVSSLGATEAASPGNARVVSTEGAHDAGSGVEAE